MKRYTQIKDLEIYKDRPELLEAYCLDAGTAMQRGFSLDAIKNDPEQIIDKAMVKSYAKELRSLSNKNDAIMEQLDRDVEVLIEAKDYMTLSKINAAGFLLSDTVMIKVVEAEKNAKLKSDIKTLSETSAKLAKKADIKEKKSPTTIKKEVAIIEQPKTVNAKEKKAPKPTKNEVVITKPKVEKIDEIEVVEKKVAMVEQREQNVEVIEEVKSTIVKKPETPVEETPKKELTKIQFYTQNLSNLKEELYTLREEQNEEQMACLNDITAINYWMIKVLEHEYEACERRDAIKQMKSYDKASATSCGRSSMRYVEWHGRIKPYVGKRLFEAEAGCTR